MKNQFIAHLNPNAGKTGRPWTQEDIRFVREHYSSKGSKYIAEALGRTVDAVQQAARKHRILSARSRPWTDREIEFLRANYPTRGVAFVVKTLNRTAERAYEGSLRS